MSGVNILNLFFIIYFYRRQSGIVTIIYFAITERKMNGTGRHYTEILKPKYHIMFLNFPKVLQILRKLHLAHSSVR